MSEIWHFFVSFSTHTLFFGVGGITLDLWPTTNKGRRSDRPLCRIFDRYSFWSANQNCINRQNSNVLRPLKRRPSDRQKCLRNGGVVGFNSDSVGNLTHSDTRRVGLSTQSDTLIVGHPTGGSVGVMARPSEGLTGVLAERRKSDAYWWILKKKSKDFTYGHMVSA